MLLVILITGLLDGLGFTLFIPLLNIGTKNPGHEGSVQKYFDQFFQYVGLEKQLSTVLILIAFVFILKGLVKFLDSFYRASLLEKLIIKIRTKIFAGYSKTHFDFYVNSSNGFWNNILIQESKKMVAAFTVYVRVLATLASSLTFLLLSFFINAQMTTVGFIAGALFFILMTYTRRKAEHLSKKVIKQNARLQELIAQIVNNFKYLKATNRFTKLLKQTTKSTEDVADTQKNLTLVRSISESISEPFIVMVLSALIYFQTVVGSKPLSEILISLVLLNKVIRNIMTFQNTWQTFLAMTGSIDITIECFEDLDRNRENFTGEDISNIDKEIKLENISHRYGSIQALDDINITIKKNTTVAFVGHSGSGKSTIVNVISSLLKPTDGQVYYDNKNLTKLNPLSIRNLIGYVTQESVIFQDSVANNITCWDDPRHSNYSYTLQDSIAQANADEFIDKLEAGVETPLGDLGINLSGGQRQRISIAREFYKRPQLLILDEATSALDSKSEDMVRKSIDNMKGQLTVLMIAHRISTVQNADMIYVLDKGRIVEKGSFKELLEGENPIFQELHEYQNMNT